MKKLICTLFVVLLGAGFISCEQEDVQPFFEEPEAQFTVEDESEEDSGVKKR